jgi:argininosuccinate synthase
MAQRVVLAYSGGLDTSVAVRWMIENYGVEVVTVACNLGQEGDWEGLQAKAFAAGAIEAIVVDCREEFADEFLAPSLKANALYEGKYPLVSALSRPVIVKHLVAAARLHNADAVPMGVLERVTTRFVSKLRLAPSLPIWKFSLQFVTGE